MNLVMVRKHCKIHNRSHTCFEPMNEQLFILPCVLTWKLTCLTSALSFQHDVLLLVQQRTFLNTLMFKICCIHTTKKGILVVMRMIKKNRIHLSTITCSEYKWIITITRYVFCHCLSIYVIVWASCFHFTNVVCGFKAFKSNYSALFCRSVEQMQLSNLGILKTYAKRTFRNNNYIWSPVNM